MFICFYVRFLCVYFVDLNISKATTNISFYFNPDIKNNTTLICGLKLFILSKDDFITVTL